MAAAIQFANDAKTTLAGGITNVATTVNLSPGSGALFPTLGTGQYFMGTFRDAATRLISEIVKVTARSSDTLTIVRAQEGTTAVAWSAGDLFGNLWTAGSAALIAGQAFTRTQLSANLNLYVATTGSDTLNTGLSVGSPFATIQKAWNVLVTQYDLLGFGATINIANGTYTAGLVASFMPIGSSSLSAIAIVGNAGSPSSVIISTTNAHAISAAVASSFTVSGVTLTASGTTGGSGACGIASFNGGLVAVTGPVVFGACAGFHMWASSGAIAIAGVAYTITGGAVSHILSTFGAINVTSLTTTLTGTPAFSGAFANATIGGIIQAISVTYSGAATGVRYVVALNGVVNTNGGGASYFPGNSAGSSGTGGQYA